MEREVEGWRGRAREMKIDGVRRMDEKWIHYEYPKRRKASKRHTNHMLLGLILTLG